MLHLRCRAAVLTVIPQFRFMPSERTGMRVYQLRWLAPFRRPTLPAAVITTYKSGEQDATCFFHHGLLATNVCRSFNAPARLLPIWRVPLTCVTSGRGNARL
jgi:hypothetical protein